MAPVSAHARPGQLDRSFGHGGVVTTPLNVTDPKDTRAAAGLVEADGKVIAVGTTGSPTSGFTSGSFALVRYGVDGALDPSFGTGGVVLTDPGFAVQANGAAFGPDGRIVVVGTAVIGSSGDETVLARYTPDGALDPSFGSGGVVVRQLGTASASPKAVAVQPDGKILVAAQASAEPDSILVARLDPDGSLDASFGAGGTTATSFGSGATFGARANAILVQPDGKVVVVGSEGDSKHLNFALARYNADGSPDASFGTGGAVKTFVNADFGPVAGGAILQPDGKLVVSALTNGCSPCEDRLVLARYDPNGSLDAGFGSGGLATATLPCCSSGIMPLALQSDGKIVTAISGITAVRFTAGGSLDTGFGTGGIAKAALENPNGTAVAVGVQPTGRIVVAGDSVACLRFSHIGCTYEAGELGLAGFTSGGAVDAGFGNGGTVNTSLGSVSFPGFAQGHGIVVEPGGRAVVAGSVENLVEGTTSLGLAAYQPNGSLEGSFGSGGTIVDPSFGAAKQAFRDGHGRIVLAGHFALERLRRNGSLDRSFGDDGRVKVRAAVKAAALEANGKIVVAGNHEVFRFNRNGSSDRSFGHRGKASPTTLRKHRVEDMVIQRQGRIVVLANTRTVALTRRGRIDRSFGRHGRLTVPIRATHGGPAQSGVVDLLSLGRKAFLAVGQTLRHVSGPLHREHVVLLRYHANGTVDRSFGRRGRVVTRGTPVVGQGITAAARLTGGNVAVAGQAADGRFALVRFNGNGSLDRSFGHRGHVVAHIKGTAEAIAAASKGRILVAGSSPSPSGSDLLLARFRG